MQPQEEVGHAEVVLSLLAIADSRGPRSGRKEYYLVAQSQIPDRVSKGMGRGGVSSGHLSRCDQRNHHLLAEVWPGWGLCSGRSRVGKKGKGLFIHM